jgi:predicted Zn-dependent peptidase
MHRYILKNARGIVTANVPEKNEKEIKYNILNNLSHLRPVEPNNYRMLEIHKDIKSPVVLTASNFNSQADISQVYRFERENSIKESAVIPVLNSILSSSSIGLFDILREKENLAYSVFSDYSTMGNQGQLSLNILTTTDNKKIGEYSYDNVQKSINGFKRQIQALLDGKFTDEDLENAKRSIKADLLENEGNYSKIEALSRGLNSPYGINLKDKIYAEANKITRQDIIDAAQKIFSKKPIYSIVASQDTLDANKEFLDGLKG